MKTNYSRAILRAMLSVSLLLAVGFSVAATTTTVNLTAQRMTATMPDGTAVPMWGYCQTAAAGGVCPLPVGATLPTWTPGPTITLPYDATGTNLQVNLTNNLPIPTSIVVLGQLGGGLGTPVKMASPTHNNTIGVTAASAVSNIASISESGTTVTVNTTTPHGLLTGQSAQIDRVTPSGYNGGPFVVNVTTPTQFTYTLGTAGLTPGTVLGTASQLLPAEQAHTTFVGNGPASPAFVAPDQPQRVKSFATEVAAGTSTTSPLTWNNLRPGTYIYETGTLPSLQAPMGLYGVLIVTTAPVPAAGTTAFAPGVAYPVTATTPAVPYDGDTSLLFSEVDSVQNHSVDAAALASTDVNLRFNDPACAPAAGPNRCYPAAVNFTPTYFLINGYAFDKTAPAKSAFSMTPTYAGGKVLVRLLNAGLRTHIPTIVGLPMSLAAEDGNVAPGNFKVQSEVLLTAGKTYDVLVVPANNGTGTTAATSYNPVSYGVFDRQGSLSTANQGNGGMQGFVQVAGGALPLAVIPTAVADTYAVPYNTSINGDVRTNDIAVIGGAVVTGNNPAKGTLSFNPDGTFIYVPATNFIGTDTFTYNGNGGTTNTVTVTLNVATGGLGANPTANADTYTSNVATKFSIARPGVLANDNDPSGHVLTATAGTPAALNGNPACASVSLNADGSFFATAPAAATACTFTYQAKNTLGQLSTAATVTVNFGAPGTKMGLNVAVVDAATGNAIADYRWTIQEDLTFKHDVGVTPSPSARTLGTSFHRSHMAVIATGCVGAVSCGTGQQVNGATVPPQAETAIAAVTLDPTKHYYVSVLPGDGANPVGGCDQTAFPTVCDPSGAGHIMGGAEIKPQVGTGAALAWDPITIKLQPTPLQPAQLSVYIYEDSGPTNGQNDLNEQGLGGFNIILVDAVGRSGDPAGQQTYDAFNMPLTNSLLGTPGCPDDQNTSAIKDTPDPLTNPNGDGHSIVGAIYTCPNAPNPLPPGRVAADYALAGHALIKNITPARYDVIAHPSAAREGAGEIWWQTETLEGTPAQDAFTGINEPRYFQEFGPPGFHTTIGFVNPAHVTATGAAIVSRLPAGTALHNISGKITNKRMSRPSDVTLYDSGAYDALASTTCRAVLNSQAGDGAAVAITECAPNGSFTLTGVPAGDYEVQIFDQWLDQIIQAQAVTVGATDVALGNIPVLTWFTQYDHNIFLDLNKNGVYDPGEPGVLNVPLTVRYRNGSISNSTLSDAKGNGIFVELFPLFNWYVAEADTTRYKQTGVNIVVDGGGPADTTGPGSALWNSHYATGEASVRTEIPGSLSYGIQSFIGQRNKVDWGRTPYVKNENGGILGLVVYSSTRPFDDMRLNTQTIWEPLVPRVTMNLYHKDKLPDGSDTLTLVDTTKTSSWDDWVNAVDANGIQVNMQCPGQVATDPFVNFTLAPQNPGGPVDRQRCYDGFHNWNQVQKAPYDGRYSFPSDAYKADPAHQLTAAQIAAGQTLISLPPGQYVVEAVTPIGYEIVKEEDKNILIGDAFNAPAVQQFGPLASIFILPDQATLNNANPNNPNTGDPGFQSNPTTNLGVSKDSGSISFPDCVGNIHRVPDFLSLYPAAAQVAPFAGMDRPLCDRKHVNVSDQQQSTANFFVFTPTHLAGNATGIILDDASAEFNAAAPDFGEKASVPFVPVSIKDFTGLELTRTYSDQWGAYNMLTPSSWYVNPPTPSGYGPNMLVTCMNDPGPIPERDATGKLTGRLITDPQYNPAYSNFCYTNPFMPGQTTYLDTPVLPIAAFAAGYNPADCAYPDTTPAIARVDAVGSGVTPGATNFGPYLPATGGTLTIRSQGLQNVPNPAYAGPFALTGPTSQRTVQRNYGFGAAKGTVAIGSITIPAANVTWSDAAITINVPSGTPTGELVVTATNGKSTVDAVTVTLGGTAPTRVLGSAGQTIQAAIDAATPGNLILVDAGTYNELVVMWKPVRLQGVGAASVIINAAKFPTSKLETWRPTINNLFAVDGTTGNATGVSQVDPLPTQVVTGGAVLLEPTVLGTEEGAGITVLAKNPAAVSCTNTAVSNYSTDGGVTFHQLRESNFTCASSRIDGISVTGGDAGGGIYVNGWAHNLEIANNRVYGNAGAFNGGVRIGVPYLETAAFPGQLENANGGISGTPTIVGGRIAGLDYDHNVKIHHNAITKNGTVEAPAGNGGAGGGVSICTGTDDYSVDHNWICGNYSSNDGGGIGHIGFSQNGSIANNTIIFNQSFQQTSSTHGGGITVEGEPPIVGTLSLGSGSLTIDANLIRGNFAEGGHGGGLRLQQVNGADVAAFPAAQANWHKVTVTNNIVDNNVAGWTGGGISLADTLVSVVDNNTVVSNDSAGIAGVVLANGVPLPGAVTGTAIAGVGKPGPAGISSERTSAALSGASAQTTAISNPALVNNIVWQNRSFYYSGDGRICAGNNTATATTANCTVLADQATTGQCPAGASYWDLGVVDDASTAPGANALNPTFSVLTSTTGYTGTGLSSGNPNLTNQYCNGARVTPEFPSVINPPSPKNLQVAATVDEGNNYVNMRYGPLSLTKPTTSSGAVYEPFGDYHFAATATAANSSALDHGTTGVSTHDIDNQVRPQGAAWDIGADEFVATPLAAGVSISPASLTFGNQVLGSVSALQQVTVTNTGNINLVFNGATPAANAGVSITGNFAIIAAGTTCVNGGTVAPLTSCVINVTFNPAGLPGAKAGILRFRDNAGTQTVALSGNAIRAVTVAPNPTGFATQKVGTTSTTHTVTFTNNKGTPVVFNTGVSPSTPSGTAGFSITTLLNSGVGGNIPQGEFVIVSPTVVGLADCTTLAARTLAAGASCGVGVQFKPTGSTGLFGLFGIRLGVLTFRDNVASGGAGSPQQVGLDGFATP